MSQKKARAARQKQRAEHDEFAVLKRKLRQSPLGDTPVVVAPRGEVKMSTVLGEFVAPYHSSAGTEKAYQVLLTLGTLAWNASFLPDDQQEEMMNQVLARGLPATTDEEAAERKALLRALIARRKVFFSAHKRLIVSFDLKDTGKGFQLSVASTPEEVPLKDQSSVEGC